GPSSISFGFPKTNELPQLPAFGCTTTPSIFARAPSNIAPSDFTFGAGQNATGSPFNTNPSNPNATDIQMD
ncbi:protein-tyrosine-phosphatase IBR5-like, partial [Trifolium medium]|nr:protein-tyrosine-phosphatase IBR5-like [Trifolium medium]